jgi:hypothetical protein
MKKVVLVALIVFLVFPLMASKYYKTEKVERVFICGPDRYMFLIRCTYSNSKNIMTPLLLRIDDQDGIVQLFDDVKKGNSMWIKYKGETHRQLVVDYLEIHIHSAKDVEGGEYTYNGTSSLFGGHMTYSEKISVIE